MSAASWLRSLRKSFGSRLAPIPEIAAPANTPTEENLFPFPKVRRPATYHLEMTDEELVLKAEKSALIHTEKSKISVNLYNGAVQNEHLSMNVEGHEIPTTEPTTMELPDRIERAPLMLVGVLHIGIDHNSNQFVFKQQGAMLITADAHSGQASVKAAV